MNREEIQSMRRLYSERELALPDDPISGFKTWLKEAAELPSIVEANAMVLSTLSGEDLLTSRTVLLKDVSDEGFTFFTNYTSRKANAMEINPQVSLLFPWYPMERQVIIQGVTEKVSREESESYFKTRPWSSQIGAWASTQSAPLTNREEIESRFKGASEKWPEGTEVPTPPHWGGYLVRPFSIEFWQGRRSRLHDRIRFEKPHNSIDPGVNWVINRYYP
ncbi:MAG: pyridoxamine 5'-phosphate oxidase [Candidatus Nanopelagicaceae bacterium]|jgi:pyridoxamine 5'-phosphate oxidase